MPSSSPPLSSRTRRGNKKTHEQDERRQHEYSSRRRTLSTSKRLPRPTPIAMGLFVLVLVWILASVYLTTTTNVISTNTATAGGMVPHSNEALQQLHLRREHNRGTSHIMNPPSTTTTITTDNDNIIDMRNLSATLSFDNPDGGAWKQGWNVTPSEGDLQIYVLPHSHCDPGWLKTFDDYFQSQTKHILTTVVQALQKDARRKFVWAEISYFEWWWKEQSVETRQLTERLLRNKQLEFVTGGWVMPDEANSQLYAMEVQLQEGHDFLNNTFHGDFVPKYGWSIDPFGYSPTMAFLLKKYGFKGMLIQRVHYAVKKELAQRKHLEFMWRQTWDARGEYDIFTHVMPFYSYDVPHTCGPDPSVCCQFDFARITNFGGCPWGKNPQEITSENVKERAMLLLDQYRKKANLYRSNTVLAPLGDDFRYQTPEEAESQYVNYQRIMDYINKHVPGVSIQFGTLSDYFEKVQGTFDVPVLKGSFFTYSDREEDYWSGYFTSRVFDKALDRKLERTLYAATTLGATKLELQESRRALSLFQHHDGVTGTAKTHVVQDYALRIHNAIRDAQQWIIRKLKPPDAAAFEACWQSDAPRGLSQNLCGNEGQVHVYNPLPTSQYCDAKEVHGHTMEVVDLPCEVPGPKDSTRVRFDPVTGLMTDPIQERWMVWKVKKGGAYLFFPDTLAAFGEEQHPKIELGGYIVSTSEWNRTVVVQEGSDEFGDSTVIDFIYETNLQTSNEEWFARFSANVHNEGVFHTDLNGFNFDTHHFREDMPIQSQVFPMPTLASIEDKKQRMTVLSEHAQGTASLQEGSIDIWLDRRLKQDDDRGLGQGVMDNVPTRTRLRVVLESEGYDTRGEFDITPLCRRMWDELNHPLEMFGKLRFETAQEAQEKNGNIAAAVIASAGKANRAAFDRMMDPENMQKDLASRAEAGKKKVSHMLKNSTLSQKSAPIVPFVFMVYNRADFLKIAIDTLIASDFDRTRVPLIISHDGRVPEVMSYVEDVKTQFKVIQIIHPYSCFEHPDSFPGNDEKLNENYEGDKAGNKRDGKVTCCKHHFTWMLKTVFDMEFPGMDVNAFFFLEEDYVVAPTIYQTITSGLKLMRKMSKKDTEGYFGLVLEGRNPSYDHATMEEGWLIKYFTSGPLVLTRDMWNKVLQHAEEYCTFDDYNWDWSLVHLMKEGLLPHRVLFPTTRQILHIGVTGGMHGGGMTRFQLYQLLHTPFPGPFRGTKFVGFEKNAQLLKNVTGFGGWGHPVDQEHCLKVLQG